MTVLTWLPLFLLSGLSLAAAYLPVRWHPAWTVRTLTVLAGGTLVALAGAIAVTGATFVAQLIPHGLVHGSVVLTFLSLHSEVGVLTGVAALGWGLYSTVRAVVELCRRHRAVSSLPAGSVVADDEPYAMAVPGRLPRIIVSSGLKRRLDPDQIGIVYAHEWAHLRNAHYRYATLARILVCAIPVLTPVEAAIRFGLERWADEEAADAVADRRRVAETISLIALARTPRPDVSLGAADFAVPRRVQALVRDMAPSGQLGGAVFGGSGLIAGGLASSPLQVHHLAALILL